jgi:hypothetical protein
MCPYYLDGDLGSGTLRFPPGDTRVIGYCAVFKVRGEPKVGTPPVEVSQNSTALRPGMGRSSSVDVSKAGVLDTELGAAEAEARDALLAGAPG